MLSSRIVCGRAMRSFIEISNVSTLGKTTGLLGRPYGPFRGPSGTVPNVRLGGGLDGPPIGGGVRGCMRPRIVGERERELRYP